jgi:hypothetical protein
VGFDDRVLFPARSVEFDCALLMRDVDHEVAWQVAAWKRATTIRPWFGGILGPRTGAVVEAGFVGLVSPRE